MRVETLTRLMAVTAVMSVTLGLSVTALADPRYGRYGYERPLLDNPVVRQSLIGAGVGAVTGAVRREGSVVRSAGVGAITGAATGAIDYTGILDGRPLARRAAKGAVIGTGASAVADRSKTKGAIIGAGAGAAYHLLKRNPY